MEILLTEKEAITTLRTNPTRFRKIVSGKVKGMAPPPFIQMGPRRLFRRESLEQWVASQETKPGIGAAA